MQRFLVSLLVVALLGALSSNVGRSPATASPGVVVFREPAFGLPHIYADTDLELAREAGRQAAKDRLGQLVLVARVARGTLFQAVGILDPGTAFLSKPFTADALMRKVREVLDAPGQVAAPPGALV